MPMTEQGFRKYTYAELLEQQITRAKDLFGDDIDTSGKSVLGKYIRLNVSDFAQQEEALEALYQARYVDTACGVSLDRLAPFAGLQRNAAVAAVLALVLYNHGKSEVELPMGTKLVNSDGTLYHLTQRITTSPLRPAVLSRHTPPVTQRERSGTPQSRCAFHRCSSRTLPSAIAHCSPSLSPVQIQRATPISAGAGKRQSLAQAVVRRMQ